MAKLTEYPRATSFDEGDILIKDGVNGTKKILVSDASKFMGSEIIMINETAGENTKVVVTTTDEDISLATTEDLQEVAEDIAELQTQLPYNSYNIVEMYGDRSDKTSNGIALHWTDGTHFTVKNAASGYGNFNLIASSGAIPSYIKSGDVLKIKYSSNDNDVKLQIIPYISGSAGNTISINSDSEYEIPANLTGITIRIRADKNNKTYDATGSLQILNAESNNTIYSELMNRIYGKSVAKYVSNNTITLADIIEDGYYSISDSYTITDAPNGLQVSALKVENYGILRNGKFVKQTAEALFVPNKKIFKRFSNSSGVFSAWIDETPIDSSGGIITPTGDTTDRSAEIIAKLTADKICRLSAGTYYVSGIEMPEDSMLIGSGDGTVIKLLDSVTAGAAVTLNHRCKIENIRFVGADSRQGGGDSIGTRDGVYYEYGHDTATGNDYVSVINNCSFIGFSGGGIHIFETGRWEPQSVSISNCFFKFNKAGIYLDKYAEFNCISNCIFTYNYFGALNNGGNNKFVNCGFDSNSKGFAIDGSNIVSPNNGHGSCVGCSFNHNSINGIIIKSCAKAYIFDGCCIYLNVQTDEPGTPDMSIDISDSAGISFSNCLMGPITADLSNSSGCMMNFCRFGDTPTIDSGITLINCYTTSGTAVTN